MRAFERAEITTIELPDELQFVVVRHAGWAERFGAPVAVAAIALWFWFSGHEILSLLFAVVGGISLVANWARGRATKLRVTETEFVASGNLDQFFSTEARAQTSDVTSIGYELGSENEPSGLYARTGWSHTCLLPGLNEEQANSIAATVSKRFPEIPVPDLTPASVLFGDESGITTLGLSSSEQGDPSKNV